MVMQRRQSLFFGLALTVALVLAVGLPPATAAAVLTGETLSGSSTQGNSSACPTYSVSGNATGPYPGTFQETGSLDINAGSFSATFTITSGATRITGSKEAHPFAACNPGFVQFPAAYTATIHTPNGNFRDDGQSTVAIAFTGPAAALLTETFTSSLAEPVLIAPTSGDQCKNGGWRAFPQFKNQGQCVSSVQGQPQT
jgi:hypothetical protein